MEYTRKMPPMEEGGPDGRNMEFGTVLLTSGRQDSAAPAAATAAADADDSGTTAAASGASGGANVAEMLVTRGLAKVIRHRDFEERSSAYDALLAAEARAVKGKKNMHSNKEVAAMHLNDMSLPVSCWCGLLGLGILYSACQAAWPSVSCHP